MVLLGYGPGSSVGSALACWAQNCGFNPRLRMPEIFWRQTFLTHAILCKGRYTVGAVRWDFDACYRTLRRAKLFAVSPCGIAHGHSCLVTLTTNQSIDQSVGIELRKFTAQCNKRATCNATGRLGAKLICCSKMVPQIEGPRYRGLLWNLLYGTVYKPLIMKQVIVQYRLSRVF